MPLLRQACFCCCTLRTGVITISILCIISSAYNLYNNVATVTTKYDSFKYDFKKIGLSTSRFDDYTGFIYANIALQILGITAAFFALVPSVKSNQENAKEKREYVIPFIIWCILVFIYSDVFMIWIFAVLPSSSAIIIQIGIAINVVFIIWAFLVNFSYYQLLKENHGRVLYAAPSNIEMQNVMPQQLKMEYNMGV